VLYGPETDFPHIMRIHIIAVDNEAEEEEDDMTKDWTTHNWQIVRHVYAGWAELRNGTLHNLRLPEPHFQALVLAAQTKAFGRRSRGTTA